MDWFKGEGRIWRAFTKGWHWTCSVCKRVGYCVEWVEVQSFTCNLGGIVGGEVVEIWWWVCDIVEGLLYAK